MANPQLENGYLKIATEIFDKLYTIRIPGEARQILDFIIRKTYGWNKKEDAISLSQFSDATGLSKVHVCRGLQILLQMRTITQKGNTTFTQKGKGISQVYEFNKDYDKWIPLPKKVTLPKKVKGITQKGNEPLPKKGTTIEDTTKDTITKDILLESSIQARVKNKSNPEIRKVIDYFATLFQKHTGERYIVNGGKDGNLIKKLLGKDGKAEELFPKINIFFTVQDDFIDKQTGRTIGIFYNQFNKLNSVTFESGGL